MLIELSDDLELEDLMELIAEAAMVSPFVRAELDRLAAEAERMLAALEQQGRIRIVRDGKGTPIAAELLHRALH